MTKSSLYYLKELTNSNRALWLPDYQVGSLYNVNKVQGNYLLGAFSVTVNVPYERLN